MDHQDSFGTTYLDNKKGIAVHDHNNHNSATASITDSVSDQERPLTVKEYTVSVGVLPTQVIVTRDEDHVVNCVEELIANRAQYITIVDRDVVL